MPRRPREQVAGGIYHVVARGNNRQTTFRDDHDRRICLGFLSKTVARKRWHALAYCLMTNHLHVVVETPIANLASGMQWFLGHYGRAYNDRHELVGHVFQDRYKAVLAKTDEQLMQTIRYVVLNPVEAGLVSRPEAYVWSSHHAFLHEPSPPCLDIERLLDIFGALGGEPRARYMSFIEGGLTPVLPTEMA